MTFFVINLLLISRELWKCYWSESVKDEITSTCHLIDKIALINNIFMCVTFETNIFNQQKQIRCQVNKTKKKKWKGPGIECSGIL